MCEQAMPLLAAMHSEPRDPRWAVPMEALVAKSMQVGGKDWVQIRALECRSTRCALEYAVYVDDLDHDVDGDQDLERLMEPVGGMVAPEVSQGGSGRGLMVSVLFWTKRPPPLGRSPVGPGNIGVRLQESVKRTGTLAYSLAES
jgi:hypothetical protein